MSRAREPRRAKRSREKESGDEAPRKPGLAARSRSRLRLAIALAATPRALVSQREPALRLQLIRYKLTGGHRLLVTASCGLLIRTESREQGILAHGRYNTKIQSHQVIPEVNLSRPHYLNVPQTMSLNIFKTYLLLQDLHFSTLL